MVFTAGSHRDAEYAKLRVGSRVPVLVGKDGNFQYVDIGTNLDCRAEHLEDGRYALRLSLERSWVQSSVRFTGDDSTSASGGNSAINQPVIGQYKTDAYLLARDGQTVETTVATDPLSGKQLKIEVTLNTPK
jgi:type II secretory pathway component GspD/PulD (secretin)